MGVEDKRGKQHYYVHGSSPEIAGEVVSYFEHINRRGREEVKCRERHPG
jgi:hypothetical protein